MGREQMILEMGVGVKLGGRRAVGNGRIPQRGVNIKGSIIPRVRGNVQMALLDAEKKKKIGLNSGKVMDYKWGA